MGSQIRVAILDDHQSIIDGYSYRLSGVPEIEIVATGNWGEELEPMLHNNPVDVLLVGAYLRFSPDNHNPFPLLPTISGLLQRYPTLKVLIISLITAPPVVAAFVKAGINGYIFKDDSASIKQLGKIVMMIANGGIYFSSGAQLELLNEHSDPLLTPRQIEALSICAAYPDSSSDELSKKLGVSSSTFRNLLSGAYTRLGCRTRSAAIAKAQALEILCPNKGTMMPVPEVELDNQKQER